MDGLIELKHPHRAPKPLLKLLAKLLHEKPKKRLKAEDLLKLKWLKKKADSKKKEKKAKKQKPDKK